MHDYSTSPGKRAGYALSFTTLCGEKGILKGEFSPRPLATSSPIKLSGVTLEAYYPEEYSRYLRAVYSREEFPKPRNILEMIKALPDAEMKKLILVNTVVGEQQLRSLAETRAAGVRAFLVQQGKIDSVRVLQGSGDMYRAPAKGGEAGSRVEFEFAAE